MVGELEDLDLGVRLGRERAVARARGRRRRPGLVLGASTGRLLAVILGGGGGFGGRGGGGGGGYPKTTF